MVGEHVRGDREQPHPLSSRILRKRVMTPPCLEQCLAQQVCCILTDTDTALQIGQKVIRDVTKDGAELSSGLRRHRSHPLLDTVMLIARRSCPWAARSDRIRSTTVWVTAWTSRSSPSS